MQLRILVSGFLLMSCLNGVVFSAEQQLLTIDVCSEHHSDEDRKISHEERLIQGIMGIFDDQLSHDASGSAHFGSLYQGLTTTQMLSTVALNLNSDYQLEVIEELRKGQAENHAELVDMQAKMAALEVRLAQHEAKITGELAQKNSLTEWLREKTVLHMRMMKNLRQDVDYLRRNQASVTYARVASADNDQQSWRTKGGDDKQKTVRKKRS